MERLVYAGFSFAATTFVSHTLLGIALHEASSGMHCIAGQVLRVYASLLCHLVCSASVVLRLASRLCSLQPTIDPVDYTAVRQAEWGCSRMYR